MPLHVSSTYAHHQEIKIALQSLWYHHTYRCDDTRGCVMQFWSLDDEHMCSKHVEAWNKLTVKQTFCASSSLITEINIQRCTVSKTSKKIKEFDCPYWAAQNFGGRLLPCKLKTAQTLHNYTYYTSCVSSHTNFPQHFKISIHNNSIQLFTHALPIIKEH